MVAPLNEENEFPNFPAAVPFVINDSIYGPGLSLDSALFALTPFEISVFHGQDTTWLETLFAFTFRKSGMLFARGSRYDSTRR